MKDTLKLFLFAAVAFAMVACAGPNDNQAGDETDPGEKIEQMEAEVNPEPANPEAEATEGEGEGEAKGEGDGEAEGEGDGEQN